MYILICILLSALYISLAVAVFFIRTEKWAKISMILSACAGVSGVILSVFAAIKASVSLSVSDASQDAENVSWAADAFSGYLKDVLPVFAVISFLVILSLLVQPEKKFLRVIITCASSVLSLIYGYITILLTSNAAVSVSFEIETVSAALSLLLSFFFFFDFRRLAKQFDKEKTKEKKKK